MEQFLPVDFIWISTNPRMRGLRPPSSARGTAYRTYFNLLRSRHQPGNCRQNPRATARINVEQTLWLTEVLGRVGSAVIFLSTNLVFDGTAPMVKPEKATNPKTEYGRQKTLVEKSLLQGAVGGQCSVVRLSKVFHRAMPLLGKWTTDLKEGRTIFPLSDLVCAPIAADFVTEVLARLAESPSPGIFQVSADRDVSYAEIAMRLAQLLKVDEKLVQPRSTIELGLSLEYLPAHTTMDASRIVGELGLTPPPVWTTLDSVLSDVIGQ